VDRNLLFTSAGRRVGLVRAFRREMDALGHPGSIVTADVRSDAPAHYFADRHLLLPPVDAPGYLDALLGACERHGIGWLIPLIDPELTVLAANRSLFEAIGTTVVLSSAETVRLSSDKRLTYAFFREHGIATPRTYDAEDPAIDRLPLPLFLKPADGSASQHTHIVRTAEELAFYRGHVPNAVVQDLIEGEEYTFDAFCDVDGAVRCVVPRLRIATRAGETSKGRTVRDPRLIEACWAVAEALPGAVGCITLQAFLTRSGEILFTELNPRFGGGYPLSYAAGANYPRWLLERQLGRAPAIDPEAWRDGVVMLRYDDAVILEAGDHRGVAGDVRPG